MGHVIEEGGLCAVGVFRRSQRVGQRLLALSQFAVLFLQLQAGAFLFLDFHFCSPGITHEQEDDKRRDDQDDGSNQCHMFQHHIQKTIGIKVPCVSVGDVLRVIAAEHIDSPVEELQQTLVADFHTEAAVVAVPGLMDGKGRILSVLQDLVGSQTVKRRASDLTGGHGGQAVLDGRTENDLRLRIMRPHMVILHAVILVHGKTGRRLFTEFTRINQGGRNRNDGA